MSKYLLGALRISLISSAIITVTACGSAALSGGKKSARSDRLSGDKLQGDCHALGNPNQQVQPPCGGPGQSPIPSQPCYSTRCDPNYVPPTQPNQPGTEPNPFPPGPQAYDPAACGTNGLLCDNGGPVQYPGQTITGGTYDRGDVDGCLGVFRNAGYDVRGQWGVDVREISNVSVLNNSLVQDIGLERRLVIIHSVAVLSHVRFELMNPNALYCIQSVNVFNDLNVASCNGLNVVAGSDVSVLARTAVQTVNCQY